MAEQDDVLHLIDDSGTAPEASGARKWKVAVIDDDPAVPGSPTTTYWVAADLDGLVMRFDRETAGADGKERKSTIGLTNVHVGADPGLFAVPEGWAHPRP